MDDVRESIDDFHRKSGSVAPLKYKLNFGTQLQVPVRMYSRTAPVKIPSFKKSVDGHTVDRQVSYVKTSGEDNEGPAEHEALPENRVKLFAYGTTAVPVNADDELFFAGGAAEKGFEVIGCVQAGEVQRWQFTSNVHVIAPEFDSAVARASLSAITKALISEDLLILVRYLRSDVGTNKSRSEASPKLALLHPILDENFVGFYATFIPFADDIREWSFSSLPTSKSSKSPTGDQLAAMEEFVKSVDLVGVNEEGDSIELLAPEDIHVPQYHYFSACMIDRAAEGQQKSSLPEIDSRLLAPFERDPTIWSTARVSELKSTFNPSKIEPKKKDDKKMVTKGEDNEKTGGLADLLLAVPAASNNLQPDNIEPFTLPPFSDLPGMGAENLRRIASSMFPDNSKVGEFRGLWSNDISSAISGMETEITRMFDEGDEDDKVLTECVYAFGVYCVMSQDEDRFMQIKQHIKQLYLDQMIDDKVWAQLCAWNIVQ